MSYVIPVGEAEHEPVSLADARLQVRIAAEDGAEDFEDSLVETLVLAARKAAEEFTGRLFAGGLYEMRADKLSACMLFPVAPVSEIVKVEYVDDTGAVQELGADQYALHAHPDHPALLLVPGAAMPALHWMPGSVRVRFKGGYAKDDPDLAMAIAAMKLTIGHLYANREAVVVGVSVADLSQGVQSLLWPYRRGLGV